MTRAAPDDPQDDDDAHDPEGPDPHEMDASDEPDLDVCPHCRKMIWEDAHRCPHCGEFISPSDTPMSARSWVMIAVIIALLLAGVLWMM
jgi:hypothetical protein